MQPSLTEKVVTKRLKVDGTNYAGAAGQTDLTSEAIDTAGYEGVRFIAGFGTIAAGAVTFLKVRQGALSNMTDGADLAGSKIDVADDDDNKIAITDIFRPEERYLDVVFDRGTADATIDFLIVELYGTRKQPVTQDPDTVIAAEIFNSPAEGTA